MTTNDHSTRRTIPSWRAAWPCWLTVIYAGLVVVRLLPAGPERAAVAAPILLAVPGALTLGALPANQRPRGVRFACLTAILSVTWVVLASLVLHALGVLITAGNTYWCLLIICALLAAVAQSRHGHSVSDRSGTPQRPDTSAVGGGEASRWVQAGYPLAAMAAGIALLAGGTHSYLHTRRPAQAGYTWIAWSGPQVKGIITVNRTGITMPFEIEHQQSGTATFRLTAAWSGMGRQHSLAKPLTVRIGPHKTLRGSLAIPPPPGGCVYRIVVTLTEAGQADHRSWSVNADIRQQNQRQNACAP